ncbi:MAG: nucleotidyltransferase family protein [Chthoniobacterales bacterium]
MTSEHLLAQWPVAILAGGLATRLRPKTETVPKAMLEVAGVPFITHQLSLLHKAGFRDVLLCAGHLGEQIESYLADGSQVGMNVQYSYDGPKLLGTGGALRKALPLLGPRFVVLYGDSYLPVDYKTIVEDFVRKNKPALMTVFKNDGHWDRSNVSFVAGQIRCYNKRKPTSEMHYIDYGLGVLTEEAFQTFADISEFDLADLYADLVNRAQLAGCEVKNRFYEIGSPEGLTELDHLLRHLTDRDQTDKDLL